ncbi:MAG: hypothetical protein Sapg2KO_40010 [Saprospiraceae bacterium]
MGLAFDYSLTFDALPISIVSYYARRPGSNVAKRNTMIPIKGLELDEETRCTHWHSNLDIIAIKFACCNEFYACFDCHEALAEHPPKRWSKDYFDTEKAILCGHCQHTMTINAYQKANSQCPNCTAAFNPRCSLHWDLYFEM